VGVEVVEVDRAAVGEVLQLAFAQLLSGAVADRSHRVVERAAGGLDRGEVAQPVRVFLGRQVEHRVGGMQVGLPGCAVGQPRDLDRPEDGGKLAGVAGLDSASTDPVGGRDIDPALPHRPQVQVVLEQLAQQGAALDVEAVLELGVGEHGGVGAVEEGEHRVEPLTAGGEPARCPVAGRAHRGARSAASATSSAARPASPWVSSLACAAR